ncbi:MAG TPA: hypothetical protein VMH22_07525 [bacterium]|nr:hypothetical protein [bacterium]
MSVSAKVLTTRASSKRWRVVSYLALVAAAAAVAVGLVGVLHEAMSAIDLLLIAGGMLVGVLGIRGLYRARSC